MFAPGKPPGTVFVSAEGRGRFKHFNCDETPERLLNRDGRVGLGLTIGEYKLVRIHKIVLNAVRLGNPKKVKP